MNQVLRLTVSKHSAHDLSAASGWLAAAWQALPKSLLRRLFGLQEHLSLEIVAEPGSIRFQIWAPYPPLVRVMVGQIKAHFPDVQTEGCGGVVPEFPTFVTAELVLDQSREMPLRTPKQSEADPMAGILASMSGLSADEWAMIQILVRPALAHGLETMAFETIIRLLAGAQADLRAHLRRASMIAAFGPFGGENSLKPTRIQANAMGELQAIRCRQWPLIRLTRMLLTLEELTALYHLPSPARVHNRCLEVVGARRLAPRDLLRHLAMFGATGTGKSTLLLNMALDLAELGLGVSVMDPRRGRGPLRRYRIPGGVERLDRPPRL